MVVVRRYWAALLVALALGACGGKAGRHEDEEQPLIPPVSVAMSGSGGVTGGTGSAQGGARVDGGSPQNEGEPKPMGAGGALPEVEETAGAGGAGGDGGAVTPHVVPGDINADDCVDVKDWAILERHWGCSLATCGDARADLQPDGWIDQLDELILSTHWLEGTQCPTKTCTPRSSGEGGAGGADAVSESDLNRDGCVDWDDIDVVVASYGCGPDCAAPGTDLVPDGCVDDRDLQVLTAQYKSSSWCAEP